MKILFWLSIGLDRRATSEHLLTAMVEALYDQGHTVHIMQKDTNGDRNEIPPRMHELGVTTNRILCTASKGSKLITRYLADAKYYLKGGRWLRKHRDFDRVFIQSSNLAGLQVFLIRRIFRKIPITYNVQDVFPENAGYSGTLPAGSIAYKFLSRIQKYAYQHADRIITISEDMKDQLTELGVSEDKISVIYNWSYQDQPYDPAILDYSRVAPLLDGGKFNVVYGGNIGRMQNVETVIRTAALMQGHEDIRFHIFGDGVYREKLIRLTRENSIMNVAFHPMLDAKDAPALYAFADVNVISLGNNIFRTALPSKTATCLACGKPMVLAIGKESVFGNAMILNTNALLEDPDDCEGISRAILYFRKNGNLEKDWRSYYCRYFSRTRNSAEYADIITKQ